MQLLQETPPQAAALRTPKPCRFCLALEDGLCRTLSAEEIRRLATGATRRRLRAGTEIPGAAGEHCANLVSGIVRLSKLLPDGRQQIVALKTAPSLIGTPFLLGTDICAKALTDVELCFFPRAAFESITRKNQALEHCLHMQALRDLDEARNLLLSLGRKNARERVASFLLMIAERLVPPDSDERTVELPLTRTDIADFLGLTIETVSRQFTALKREGLIALPDARRVRLIALERLKVAAGH